MRIMQGEECGGPRSRSRTSGAEPFMKCVGWKCSFRLVLVLGAVCSPPFLSPATTARLASAPAVTASAPTPEMHKADTDKLLRNWIRT